MHYSALKSFRDFKEVYFKHFKNPRVVEIGSLSVNGEIKSEIGNEAIYTGLDLTNGPNVDIVLDDPYKIPLEDNSVDIVISISTFEHTEFFWLSYLEILRILKPNGLFFLNVPSNGHFHRYETDNWRFYPDSSLALEKWGKKNNYNPKVLEHFTLNHNKRDIWNDYISITLKDQKYEENFKEKIINNIKNFRNGRNGQSQKIINETKLPQDQDNWGWFIYFKIRKFLNKIRK